MPEYKAEYEEALHKHLKGVKGADADKMFGYPVYKANGTMAVSVVALGIIARVGEKRAKELIEKGDGREYSPQPGRVWRDWVLLTGDFDKHKKVFEQAIEHTAKLEKAKPAKAEKADKAEGKKTTRSSAKGSGKGGKKGSASSDAGGSAPKRSKKKSG